MIAAPLEDGGAGITPKVGEWKNVESIFPLHDQGFNKKWLREWSTKTFLQPEDLDEIRDRLGEKANTPRDSTDLELTDQRLRSTLPLPNLTLLFSCSLRLSVSHRGCYLVTSHRSTP